MKKIFYFLTVVIISAVVFNGFFSIVANAQNQPTSQVIHQDVQYVQLIQPAFVKDFSGKSVRFEARFTSMLNSTMDLPSKYKDYIRFMICSTDSIKAGNVFIPTLANSYSDVIIEKSKSGSLFNIKQLQIIKISAKCVEYKSTTASGGSQKSLIFVVDSIKTTN